MSQSLSSVLIHLVFSTKNREPFITPAIEPELHPYMAKILRELKSPSLAIDGTADHVHILFPLARVVTIAEIVEEIKTSTSKWIKTKGREFRNFHWQRGYGAFSIGQSNVASLKRYIRDQKEHHKASRFKMNIVSFSRRTVLTTTRSMFGNERYFALSALGRFV
ncbi:MAG TPA: IS200/IS605 family transposase [Blastocatellia bacterium]|nr:IS200/IS605 family transposase [Blastocatellia bacterium]